MGLIQRFRQFRQALKEIVNSPMTDCEIIEELEQMREEGEIKQCFECGLWHLPETPHHHDFVV